MMSKFMIVALAAAGASQQNNKRSAEEQKELKQLQRQSTAQLRTLNKTETEGLKAATEENTKAFAELQSVCQEAADKYAVNLSGDRRTTNQKTAKDANGEDIQIFMGGAAAAARRAAARQQKAKFANEILEKRSQIERINNATALYKGSHANCKACLESQDSTKCDGITEDAKKAEKEKVMVEKIIDDASAETASDSVQDGEYDVGMASSASNLLVASFFLF
jgi:hypothetical protein